MISTTAPKKDLDVNPGKDRKPADPLHWLRGRRLPAVLFLLICLAVARIGWYVASDLGGVVEGVKQIHADSLAWTGLLGRLEAQVLEAHFSIEHAVASREPELRARYVGEALKSAQLATFMLHGHLRDNLPQSESGAAEHFMREFRTYVSSAMEALSAASKPGGEAALEAFAKSDDVAFQRVQDTVETFRKSYEDRSRQAAANIEKVLRHSLMQLGGLLVVVLILSAFAVRMVEKGRMHGTVEKSEKRLRDVIESISEGTFVIDRQWILQVWNTAAERSFSRNRQDVIGRHLLVALPEIAATPLASEISTALFSGSPRTLPDVQMATGEIFEVRLFPF